MGLLDLWKNAESELKGKTIRQIISIAGEGRLGDGNVCSKEFREFLAHVSSEVLQKFAESCLAEKFDDGGFALQDVINEIGRRIGFSIVHGRYRGVQGKNGNDGLWKAVDGHTVLIEVKTTDVYRINLDTAANYLSDLIERKEVEREKSSILIVVGRQDTGDLEAQIRGSRHAWNIRLISVDALLRLLTIKEETDDPIIHQQISLILRPQEFTRLDGVVDLVFAATEELQVQQELGDSIQVESEDGKSSGRQKLEMQFANFHESCVARIREKLRTSLIRESKSIYASADGDVVTSCSVSREYADASDHKGYWYAFHPHQAERLKSVKSAYVAFGCGSDADILLIPFKEFEPLLNEMNTTSRPNGKTYWHVQIRNYSGKWTLVRKGGRERLDLTKYRI